MIKGLAKNQSQIHCPISFNCLILITIAMLFVLNSCTSVRSVRGTSKSTTKTRQAESSGKYDSQLSSFENKLKKSKEETQPNYDLASDDVAAIEQKEAPAHKLPTLSEQIKCISSEQAEIKNKVTNLQTDVVEIKSSINDIKDAINEMNGKPVKRTVTGKPQRTFEDDNIDNEKIDKVPVQKKTPKIPKKTNNRKGLILSDEESLAKPVIYHKPQVDNPVPKKAIRRNPVITKAQHTPTIKIHKQATQVQPEQPAVKEDAKALNIPENSSLSSIKKDVEQRKYQPAITALKSLLSSESNPETVNHCNYLLGESYFGLKQYDVAITHYSRIASSRNAAFKEEAQIKIAESLIRLGQAQEAKKAYQTFVQRYPTSDLMPQARKMLQQL